ncbi:MAG TPA: phospholipid carrier-dependent glycosyltransferase [Egibacteraceae bacterium]|nr:phospholipid carrier-dependent glycosyltransferase [Egibacteraceae bacterium]
MTSPAPAPLRVGACVRETPRVVWALAATLAALMGCYALAVPLYHGPDESKHVDMLFAVREPGGWPAEHERHMNAQVVASTQAAGYAPGRPARSATEAVPRHRRPALQNLAPDTSSPVPNQMWQHPPLGYVPTAVGLAIVTAATPGAGAWAHDVVVGLMRLVGALVLVPLPLLAYWTTARLAGRGAGATAAAVLVAAVPGLAHVGGTVTNDSLLIALVGGLTLVVVHVATGDLSPRTATLAGLVGGLALLTKGFALFLPAWLVGAYALAAWRGGRPALRPAATAGALALAVAAALGGWWWLRNVLRFGVVQPRASAFGAPPAEFTPELGHWLTAVGRILPRSFWGYFGWTEAALPWPVVGAAGVVLAVGLAGAFAARRPADPWRRGDVALLLGAVAGCAAIMLYGSWGVYAEAGRRVAMHGRYLMPGLVGMAAAAALGLTALARRLPAWLPAALLAGGGLLHTTAFAVIVERYWMPPGAGYREGVAALLAWSPWPPVVTATAAGLAAAGFAWAVVETVLIARAGPTVEGEVKGRRGAPTRSSTAAAS